MSIVKVISHWDKEKFEIELNDYINNWGYEDFELKFTTAWNDDAGFTFSCMVIIKDCR